MRIWIGIGIVAVCILLFGWWGLLSLIIALPYIGWPDRHKGPFPTNQNRITNSDLALELADETPNSFRKAQDILVEFAKSSNNENLISEIQQLLLLLKKEKFVNSSLSDSEILKEYILLFSDAFPNWQNEYNRLVEIINSKFS